MPFQAVFRGAPIVCNEAAGVQLTDLRFYVADIGLTDSAGNRRELTLDADDTWQQARLALVDLENGEAGCANGTAARHAVLTGTIRQGSYRGLDFTLGVPFARNHGDPLSAAAPLGDADMHWHWRGGHKFLRAGLRTANDGFWMHLGSTGCRGTIGHITACDSPNRVTVRLADYVPGDTVTIDLAGLVATGELDDGTPTDCSSGPAEEHCVNAFSALGLAHDSGAASGEQRLFSRRDRQ